MYSQKAKPHSQISIYSVSVVSIQEAEILVQPAWKEAKYWRCPKSSVQFFFYIEGWILLSPRRSQVAGGVQPILMGQVFNADVVLYTEQELRYMEENKYLEMSKEFFWDRELQCGCCFYTGNWNSTTA
jgi:hypothetical protein